MVLEIAPVVNISQYAEIAFYVLMAPLAVYSLRLYFFGVAGPLSLRKLTRFEDLPTNMLPKVSIQIPVYNDPIVKRCIDHCLRMDYPRDRYEILVADDSTDETVEVLKEYRGNDMVKVLRRPHRKGFKAGALNNALKHTKGDIIVVFDADYTPGEDFLRKIVAPFAHDDSIAYAQGRWGYLNYTKNKLTRAISMAFDSFHRCILPAQNRIGTAIFCGTGGAIRKDILTKVGGWNESSITEDMDLSVRIINSGYRQAYLPYLVAPGEVPSTMKAFIKQQQRWAYGNTAAFMEYIDEIIHSKRLNFIQKLDLSMLIPGFLVFPFVLGVFISTSIAHTEILGAGTTLIPETFAEVGVLGEMFLNGIFSQKALIIFVALSGFLFNVGMGLAIDKRLNNILYMPLIIAVGLVMQFTNTVAVFKALAGKPMGFYRTERN